MYMGLTHTRPWVQVPPDIRASQLSQLEVDYQLPLSYLSPVPVEVGGGWGVSFLSPKLKE